MTIKKFILLVMCTKEKPLEFVHVKFLTSTSVSTLDENRLDVNSCPSFSMAKGSYEIVSGYRAEMAMIVQGAFYSFYKTPFLCPFCPPSAT